MHSPKYMRVGLTGVSKVPTGVNVSGSMTYHDLLPAFAHCQLGLAPAPTPTLRGPVRLSSNEWDVECAAIKLLS